VLREHKSFTVTFTFLGRETIVYILKQLGTTDWDMERLNLSVNTSASWSAHVYRHIGRVTYIKEPPGIVPSRDDSTPAYDFQFPLLIAWPCSIDVHRLPILEFTF
jgi:hypothetical protein